jgi:hypothetical protein
MKNKLIGLVILAAILTGCSSEKTKEQLATTGIITDLGIVDGCDVKKHVRTTPSDNPLRGRDYHSFYIAKCDGQPTTTTTQQVGGKQKHDEAMIQVDKKNE